MIAKPFLILIIAPLDAGDAVAVSGLIPKLLAEVPHARFTIVAGPKTAPLFADVPELAEIITTPSYDGFAARLALKTKLSGRTWGTILDLAGGAPGRLKSKRRATLSPSSLTENRTVAAARLLGLESDPPLPFLYISPELEAASDEALMGEGPILAMGPGAEWIGRVWPAERYGQVASKLMMVDGAPLENGRIVAFGGEIDRDAVNDSIFPLPQKRIISRVYRQDLMTDYSWLKHCRLYIGGDNIWTQLAAAAGCPTVAIFGPSDDAVSAPFGKHVRVVRGPRDYATLKALDPALSFQMSHLTDLTVDPVVAAAKDLLGRDRVTETLTIRRPDDWHVHLRDGDMLQAVAHHTARQFGRAIVMPNLVPPVTTVKAASDYRLRILSATPGADFTPLMTAYLTDQIDADEIARGHAEGVFTACKLYPAGATTNSEFGVTDIRKIYPVLERMQAIGMPLLVHGEVTDPAVDIFDREAVFLDRVFAPLLNDMPGLKVVMEHVTTSEGVEFVQAAGPNVAATITPHHLRINRNAIFEGGIRPHFYCLPIAKREDHRLALRRAATSGNPKFFLGTDSAPHSIARKEMACGCAGIFNAPYAMESYATTFSEEGALDKLEGFASEYGARFYGLPLNAGTITLQRKAFAARERFSAGGDELVPFHAGQNLAWRFVD